MFPAHLKIELLMWVRNYGSLMGLSWRVIAFMSTKLNKPLLNCKVKKAYILLIIFRT